MTCFKPKTQRHVRERGRFVCILCGIIASLLIAFVMFSVEVPEALAARTKYIKFSTLAPEGSSWMKQMRVLGKALKRATKGEVAFKFYPGGVSGDEVDVIRKMRIGQVHAAGFTGVGLGQILPEVRVLDLPFLFRNDREIEYVYEKMNGYFAKRFEEKGYVLLGWVPVGWIHFFSTQEIRHVSDLGRTKAWMWEGDPLVEATYKVLKVSPHPLSVTDVLLSLQTHMVDTVYASPVGALALQWYTKVRYMSALRMGNATGAILMSKKKFDRLSRKNQEALKTISRKYLNILVRKIQEDNNKAIEIMKKEGLKVAPMPSEEGKEEFFRAGAKVRQELTGKLFDRKLIDRVLAHLKKIRES